MRVFDAYLLLGSVTSHRVRQLRIERALNEQDSFNRLKQVATPVAHLNTLFVRKIRACVVPLKILSTFLFIAGEISSFLLKIKIHIFFKYSEESRFFYLKKKLTIRVC